MISSSDSLLEYQTIDFETFGLGLIGLGGPEQMSLIVDSFTAIESAVHESIDIWKGLREESVFAAHDAVSGAIEPLMAIAIRIGAEDFAGILRHIHEGAGGKSEESLDAEFVIFLRLANDILGALRTIFHFCLNTGKSPTGYSLK